MAVLKSNRNESQLQFLDTARDLEIFTLRNCVKFPKRYTFFITTEIVRLSQSVYNNANNSNGVAFGFCTIMSVTVIPIEERNQYEYKRGL